MSNAKQWRCRIYPRRSVINCYILSSSSTLLTLHGQIFWLTYWFNRDDCQYECVYVCEIAISKCISSPAITAIDQHWPRLFKPITISLSLRLLHQIQFDFVCIYTHNCLDLPNKYSEKCWCTLFSKFIIFMVNLKRTREVHTMFPFVCVKVVGRCCSL